MLGVETLLPQAVARAHQTKYFVEPLREQIEAVQGSALMADVIDWSLITPDISSDTSRLVNQFGYDNEQERLAMYRGALFARQLTLMLYGERAVMTVPTLPISPRTGLVVESVREATRQKIMEYINIYPWIDDVLGAYTQELDPNSLYGHRIEEIGGYVIMQGEICEAEWMLFGGMDELRPEDISKK